MRNRNQKKNDGNKKFSVKKLNFLDRPKNELLFNEIVSFKKLGLLFFIFQLLFCSNTKPFEKLEPPKKDLGLLYLLRSYNSTLSLYSLKIEIWKYTGHFKNSSKKLLQEFSLNTGEFVLLNLEESFYEIFLKKNGLFVYKF